MQARNASARCGRGTRVAAVLPDSLLEVAHPVMAAPAAEAAAAGPPAERRPPRRLSDYGRRVRPFPEPRLVPVRAFRTDLPALDLFPTTLWAQVASRPLRRGVATLPLGGRAQGVH